MAALDKLKIFSYKDPDYEKLDSRFVVMFNPESYTLAYNAVYCEDKTQGKMANPKHFKNISPKDFSLALVFDGTGASRTTGTIAASAINGDLTVDQMVEDFLELGALKGDSHEPRYLKLLWGNMVLKCRLVSATINYTLFNSVGIPLRAKVEAKFTQAEPSKLTDRLIKLSSPDMTHEVVVKAGDTLVNLCRQIYGDGKYYQDVARVNKLVNFRKLEEGKVLFFPPLTNA